MPHKLKFRQLPGTYAIVRLASDAAIPAWATEGEFTSITRTADELSVVCPTEYVPLEIHFPLRWISLKLEGPFPFSQTGVLLSFIRPLSESEIPIFAISTFDTDYVLIQEEFASAAVELLKVSRHEFVS